MKIILCECPESEIQPGYTTHHAAERNYTSHHLKNISVLDVLTNASEANTLPEFWTNRCIVPLMRGSFHSSVLILLLGANTSLAWAVGERFLRVNGSLYDTLPYAVMPISTVTEADIKSYSKESKYRRIATSRLPANMQWSNEMALVARAGFTMLQFSLDHTLGWVQ